MEVEGGGEFQRLLFHIPELFYRVSLLFPAPLLVP